MNNIVYIPQLYQLNYTLLLECNQCLVSRSLDEAAVLQQTLIKIISRNEGARLA